MRQKSSEARVLWLGFHRGYLLTSSNTRNGTKQGQAREINSVSGRKEAGDTSDAQDCLSRGVKFPLISGSGDLTMITFNKAAY